MASTAEKVEVVILDWADVQGPTTPEMMEKIKKAYGYDGLGILAIRGVPGFAEARAAALPKAYAFGNLPVETKAKYEHPASMYSFGWSHGKERLEGRPDFAKGSFYANPMHDRPVDDEKEIAEHAPFCHPNIWPSEDDCAGFEGAVKACSRIIVNTGMVLARHCDAFVKSEVPAFGGPQNELASVVEVARTHKARLLYYFAMDSPFNTPPEGVSGAGAAPTSESDVSNWCGWHNDHGSLTGLAPAMFFDKDGKEIPCPDPRAGLYIRSRHGQTVRAVVPADCIAYQIGEVAQIHSGGVMQATPHCVRAAEVAGVSRGTLAVFMEPEWSWKLNAPAECNRSNITAGAISELLPKGVPQLGDRWDGDAQTFGEFTDKTLAAYY